MCKIVDEIKNELQEFRNSNGELSIKKEAIENYANRILAEFNNSSYPTNIYDIASQMGFDTSEGIFDKRELSGIIAIDKNLEGRPQFKKSKVIALNNEDNSGHQRFTTAHELGHYIFDYCNLDEPYYNYYYTNQTDTPEEMRANYFAACLLMPRTIFQTQWDNLEHNQNNTVYDILRIISENFKVSSEAAKRRYKEVYGEELKLER